MRRGSAKKKRPATIPTARLAALLGVPGEEIAIASDRRRERFQFERELGGGSTGPVYLVFDHTMKRRTAVKLLRRRLTGVGQRGHEAAIVSQVDHPAIAKVYWLEDTQNALTIMFSEYVNGETLAARIQRRPLSISEAFRICSSLASAVESLHARGILHCDIKPANVMLTKRGEPKLIDFGLACLLSSGDARPGGGTPGYASPEQARGEPVGAAADVFSLACLLFECLAGCPAFRPEKGLGVTTTGRPRWAYLPRQVPETIVRLLKECLTKNAADRVVSAGELRMTLEAALHGRASESTTPPNNLQSYFTRFVGREGDLRALSRIVCESRLVTLVGTGGCGKTRLATAVSTLTLPRFAGGTWFVELAACAEGRNVEREVALVLGVHEQPGRSLAKLLATRLQGSQTLLILDNCEHVPQACAETVHELLRACPNLHVLTTSREALQMVGEVVYRVPPLTLTADPRNVGSSKPEAVELFIDRARLVRPHFEFERNSVEVSAICQALDGIPLAIELAAVKLRSMSIGQLSSAIKDRFRVLGEGDRSASPRHQTLRSLIDWSYDLLSPDEQLVFRRLSVFAGGWSLEAARAVCFLGAHQAAADTERLTNTLICLVNKSLITWDDSGEEPRMHMLETIRQYVAEQMEETESATERRRLRDTHAAYFLRLAEAADDELTGPRQQLRLKQLAAEHDNVRAALRWFGASHMRAERLRLATSLAQFWYMRGMVSEGRDWLTEAMCPEGSLADELLAQAFNRLGVLCWVGGDQVQAIAHYEQSARSWRRVGNVSRLAAVTCNLASAVAEIGELDRAVSGYLEAIDLYSGLSDRVGTARVQLNLSVLRNQTARYRDAEVLLNVCQPVLEAEGDAHRIAAAVHNRGHALYGLGRFTQAAESFGQSLRDRKLLGDGIGIALDTLWLGFCHAREGASAEARLLLKQAEALREQTGAKLSTVDQAELLAVLACLR